jgi:hypothetical protein
MAKKGHIMSFREDFFKYAIKIGAKNPQIEFANVKRIPFIIMGLIEHVHVRIPREVYQNLHPNDKAKFTILHDKVQYHCYTYFKGSDKSLKSIRRSVIKKLQREVE